MLIISVVEYDYSVKDPDFRARYIGAPCHSFDEARELVFSHAGYDTEISAVGYVQDGVDYAEISLETGEVLKEFFVRGVRAGL